MIDLIFKIMVFVTFGMTMCHLAADSLTRPNLAKITYILTINFTIITSVLLVLSIIV